MAFGNSTFDDDVAESAKKLGRDAAGYVGNLSQAKRAKDWLRKMASKPSTNQPAEAPPNKPPAPTKPTGQKGLKFPSGRK